MSATARVIPAADIFTRISARDPYYALRTLAAFRDGVVEAEIPVEMKGGREVGPITAAEVVRHLGVLGACALAESNPDRTMHYYVLRSATLERSGAQSTATRLEARASGQLVSSDAGRARGTVMSRGGSPLFQVEMQFSVLTAARFHKLFESVKRDLRKTSRPPVNDRRPTGELKMMRNNPYGRPLTLTNVDASLGADLMEATFGPVPVAACNGHYPMYPVLPDGIVVAALSQLSGTLLRRRAAGSYVVRHAVVRTDNLALAGETVRFEARYVGGSAKNHRFECTARCGSKPVGTVSLTLQPVGSP
ncbi:MAG: hypothetical protein IPJ65_11975 [Archangiaceae bacterium]|nr:hypothetical protein [Archangiaceae bacterium]